MNYLWLTTLLKAWRICDMRIGAILELVVSLDDLTDQEFLYLENNCRQAHVLEVIFDQAL